MRFLRHISPWFTAVLLGSALSACAYIIPPEQNEPRNNIVQGGIRKPINNPDKRSDAAPMAAPVQAVQQVALPPADMATQQRAQEILEASPALDSGRRIPVENAQFQLSSNNYPAINSVPEAPVKVGADSAQSRLNATQAELEVDRSKAAVAAEALAKDAAAEPSMLSELPKIDGVVPPSDPIQSAPTIEEAPQAAPASVPLVESVKPEAAIAKPEVVVAKPEVIAEPLATQPAPLAAVKSQPESIQVPSNVTAFVPPAPLVSRVPESAPRVVAPAVAPVEKLVKELPPEATAPAVEQPVIIASPLPAPVVAAQAPAPRAGDFDPLAVADGAPITAPVSVLSRAPLSAAYAVNRYIPPSRYSGLRN